MKKAPVSTASLRRCVECGSKDLSRSSEQLPFGDVALVDAVVQRCNGCGRRYHAFARVEELSGEIARIIAQQEERLLPEQIRFLRKQLGYSGKDFAAFLDVAPETVSRWESRTQPMQMQLSTEKLIRLMALSEKPLESYGLDRAGSGARQAARVVVHERAGRWRRAVA